MKKLFLLTALFVAAAFPSCSKHDGVETPDWPNPQPLAVAFAEGNELFFGVDETKIVHYTITGGSGNTMVKAEMQNPDDAYTVETTPTSATEGTITITAKMPETENSVVITVSDGSQTVTAEIAVSTKPSSQQLAITFAEGNSLEFDVNEAKIVHYTITGGSDIPMVKAEMKNPDDAYTVEITPISTTEEAIIITAKTPTDNYVIVTVSDGSQTVTAEIAVSPRSSSQELAITFAEGNSLQLYVNEPKTIHYTITGGSNKTAVNAWMEKANDSFILSGAISATEGTIVITAKRATSDRVIVAVLDGNRSIRASIDVAVTLKAFDGRTIEVETPGTLDYLLAPYDRTTITELTITGNLNSYDLYILRGFYPAILDMEHVNLEELPADEFYGKTRLISVKLPLTLKTIGKQAFSGCRSLTSITIPDSVTSIGDRAFQDCRSLTSITIPDSVTSIGDRAFQDCSSLTSITIPDSVTSIGVGVFWNCSGLTSVTIGNGSIGDSAFYSCTSLASVTIGNDVTSIGEYAFSGCNGLTGVYITDIAKWCAIEFEGSLSNPLFYAHNLYLNDELVTDLVIPDNVTKIGSFAFQYCSNLSNVTIGNGVTSIGGAAFQYCDNLTSVTIPDGVTIIGAYAFQSCNSLTSVTIGNGVTIIGAYAFQYCSNLANVTIGNGVTSIGGEAFKGCSLTSVTIPDSVTEIKDHAFWSCDSLASIYCKAIVPPRVEGRYATIGVSETVTLYVPTGSKAAYAAAAGWKNFKTIEETQF